MKQSSNQMKEESKDWNQSEVKRSDVELHVTTDVQRKTAKILIRLSFDSSTSFSSSSSSSSAFAFRSVCPQLFS